MHNPTLQFAELPLGHGHTFFTKALRDSDLVYSELLQQIGFGKSSGRLTFQSADSGVDIISVTITAILATTTKQ